MNNHDLRAILIKIQDNLSDNDQERLSFVLNQDYSSSDGTLRPTGSLTDSDKISEQDIIYLIELFEKIQCFEAVKLLKEHMNQTQTIIPLVAVQDDEKSNLVLPDQITYCNNNNMLINSNNTNITPVTVVLGSQSKFPLQSNRRQLLNSSSMIQKCLLLFIILSIILTGLIIIGYIRFTRLKIDYDHIVNEQIKYGEMIQRLKNLESYVNRTIQHSANNVEQYFTEGNTCGCSKWCHNRGSKYGLCGNGHTCICQMQPITKEYLGDICTCDSWCRKRGHKDGGICGDGYTCICSK